MGLFLLVVDVDLKENIRHSISLIFSFLKEFLNFILFNLTGGFKIIKFSNLLGFLILLICFYLTYRRWKYRLINSNNILKTCEKCNSKLNRIKKTNFLKLLGLFMHLKIRLYECDKCHKKYKICKKK